MSLLARRPVVRSVYATAAFAAALAWLPATADMAGGRCVPDRLQMQTPTGAIVPVQIELADDAAERAQGLMGRTEMPAGQGMLFVYETPRPASFWMKNTLIPLDMLFFDARGVLRHIHENARPHDLTPIPGAAAGDPDPDRLLVLELAGGEAARLGLSMGTTLQHPAVPASGAAFPCPR